MLWIKAVELTSDMIMFEGTQRQWDECFFYTGDVNEIINFCLDRDWTVTFSQKKS